MGAWVYPLKIFREFHLKFHTEGRDLAAESLARTVMVRPESATILYAGDTFTVRETFFVPVQEQGAVILLDVETEQPLEIEAIFHRDFQLEWPAALGATYLDWSAQQRAFYFGEEQRKFSALVGSPTATEPRSEFQTNYSERQESSFRLGPTAKGKERKLIVIAGSLEGRAAAEKTYQHLTINFAQLLKASAEYYRTYLDKTVSVELPDAQIQQAYDWARISMLQGMVNNPSLGTGLVLDVLRAQCLGRFFQFARGAGIYQQIPAGRRQDPARDFAGRQFCELVQGLSVSVRFRGCDSSVPYRGK